MSKSNRASTNEFLINTRSLGNMCSNIELSRILENIRPKEIELYNCRMENSELRNELKEMKSELTLARVDNSKTVENEAVFHPPTTQDMTMKYEISIRQVNDLLVELSSQKLFYEAKFGELHKENERLLKRTLKMESVSKEIIKDYSAVNQKISQYERKVQILEKNLEDSISDGKILTRENERLKNRTNLLSSQLKHKERTSLEYKERAETSLRDLRKEGEKTKKETSNHSTTMTSFEKKVKNLEQRLETEKRRRKSEKEGFEFQIGQLKQKLMNFGDCRCSKNTKISESEQLMEEICALSEALAKMKRTEKM